MKPTDFIRQLLDMIDEVEAAQTPNLEISIDAQEPSCGFDADSLGSAENPASDIRSKYPSMYPNSQWKG